MAIFRPGLSTLAARWNEGQRNYSTGLLSLAGDSLCIKTPTQQTRNVLV